MKVRGGVTDANTARLKAALAKFPDAKIQTKSQFIKLEEGGITFLLKLLYVLLSLSILISLFGIVNTLVLTVFERTREIGMLRAVGMTRRQVRNMIRHESIITALLGAALGTRVVRWAVLMAEGGCAAPRNPDSSDGAELRGLSSLRIADRLPASVGTAAGFLRNPSSPAEFRADRECAACRHLRRRQDDSRHKEG